MGHDVSFLCPRGESVAENHGEREGITVRAHEPLRPLPVLWRSKYCGVRGRYRGTIAQCSSDAELVVSHSLPYAVATQQELPSTPLIYFCGGIESLKYEERLRQRGCKTWWKRAETLLLRKVELRMFAHASAVLFASRRSVELASEWFGRRSNQWMVCPQGVNDLTLEVDSDPKTIRDRWTTPYDVPVLVTASELTPNKNTRLIIDAMEVCRNQRVWLWIAGDGSEREELQERARRAGVEERVRFLGFERQMANVYAAANVFVLASKRDTFPNAYLEAMVSGLPLIGPKHDPANGFSAVDEMMTEGVSGLTFRQHDAFHLAAQIDDITASPEQWIRMGLAGREKALAQFSWRRHADQVLEIARNARSQAA